MKASVRVQDVEVAVTGMNLSVKDVRALLRSAASIAVALNPAAEPDAPANPVGFTAHVERGEPPKPESYFSDDED